MTMLESLKVNKEDRDYYRQMSHEAMHSRGAPDNYDAQAVVASVDALTLAVRALDLSVERIGFILGNK